MKSAPFTYCRPASVTEACALLAADEDARLIAGGQTLVPMMAMRLARPTALIDIARIPELAFVRREGDHIEIGAATRQAFAEANATVALDLPLLARALPWIGHSAIRNRGTIGGSIANADPAAEIPLVLATLGGAVVVQTPRGRERFAARDFFLGPMTTAIPADGCLVEAHFPVWTHQRIGACFTEISARHGDFAYVSAAAQVALDDNGSCVACALGVGGATAQPTQLAVDLTGARINETTAREKLSVAIETLDMMTDPHASPAYRKRAALALALRALLAARDEALAKRART